jgi:hypothetical protein
MQWFVFLWFQLQMTNQYLQEKNLGVPESTADWANPKRPNGADPVRDASPKQEPPTGSAMKRRHGGSRFGKFANNRRGAVRSSK